MAKVGTDRRLNYYQMAGDKVIAELQSHPYGLTEPEAARRLNHNGINYIRSGLFGAGRYAGLQPWFTILQITGIMLAWQLNMESLAAVLALLLLVLFAIERWREQTKDILEHDVHQLQSTKATVRRNDVLKVIDAQELVVGDIVALSADTVVPADIRLLNTTNLATDETLLFGGSGHIHKYAHALTAELPFAQRHNIAYAGTTVTHGSGEGIVVAAGTQTELGQIFVHAEQSTPKASLFSRLFHSLTRRFAWVALVLLAALGVAAASSWIEGSDAALFGLITITCLLPIGLTVATSDIFASFKRQAKKWRVRIETPSTSDRLGTIDTLLVDEAPFIIDAAPTAREFYIGKQIFQATGTGYEPHGKLYASGKQVTKKKLHELQLFFDAAVLGTQAKLLPPDSEHTIWRSAGSTTEGALLTLAARAGLDIDEVRHNNPLVTRFAYDHHRQISSSIHTYGHRQLVFAYGATPVIIERTARLWDGGHTRKFTKADQKLFLDYHQKQTAGGGHTVALAYRQLPKQSADVVDMHGAEQELVLLGVVALNERVQPSALLAIQAAHHDNIAVSILSGRPAAHAVATAKQLGIISPAVISNDDFAQLTDGRISDILTHGNAIFCHLTTEQRLRLVGAAKTAGRNVAISGRSLSDVPALRHADIGVTSAHTQNQIIRQADVTLPDADLYTLMQTLQQSRGVSKHIRQLIHTTLSNHSILLWTALIGIVLFVSNHIPLAITVPMVLFAVLLQALPYAAVGNDRTKQLDMQLRPSPHLPHSSFISVILALFAGLLVSANFVLFFVRENLSPGYIDSSSNLYLQAATVSLVGLVICMWVNLLFARAQHTDNLLSAQLRSSSLTWAFTVSGIILLLAIYAPIFQQILGTRSMNVVDWLSALWVGALFFAIRWIAHQERKRSRHAIISLHQEIHGKDASSQI